MAEVVVRLLFVMVVVFVSQKVFLGFVKISGGEVDILQFLVMATIFRQVGDGVWFACEEFY